MHVYVYVWWVGHETLMYMKVQLCEFLWNGYCESLFTLLFILPLLCICLSRLRCVSVLNCICIFHLAYGQILNAGCI